METPRHSGIEFVLAIVKEISFATQWSYICLHSVVLLVIEMSDSPCEKIGKWESPLILKVDGLLVCTWLDQWLWLALSKDRNKVGVFMLSH
jgi:hypothetical protein